MTVLTVRETRTYTNSNFIFCMPVPFFLFSIDITALRFFNRPDVSEAVWDDHFGNFVQGSGATER